MKEFIKKYLFVESWLGVAIHFAIILSIAFTFISIFFFWYLPSTTNHDEMIEVPNLENMDVNKAIQILEAKNIRCTVQDTTFSQKHKLGAIVNQQPKAGSKVKANRNIYVTINRSNVPTIRLDSQKLEKIRRTSLTQAQHELPLLGFTVGKIIEVPGFKNFVMECMVNGDTIRLNQPLDLRVNTPIDLVVGNGEEEETQDTTMIDRDI